MRHRFIFDGECGFCTRVILRLIDFDMEKEVLFTPYQCMDFKSEFPEEVDPRKSVLFVVDDSVYSGAEAFLVYFSMVRRKSFFTSLYKIKPLAIFLEFMYKIISNNRNYFPGVKPWCEVEEKPCLR